MTSYIFNFLVGPVFVAAFIGFALIFYSLKINKNADKKYIKVGVLLIGLFLAFIATAIISDSVNDKNARSELKSFLTRKDIKIVANNQTLLDTLKSNKIVNALKTITNIDAHHSHSMDRNRIKIISGKDTVSLEIGQDSEYPTEYWIFSDKYELTEIGRIRTTLDLKNGL